MGQVLRAELSPLKDLACYSPGVRSSLLYEAGTACHTAPYLAFFMIYNRKDMCLVGEFVFLCARAFL